MSRPRRVHRWSLLFFAVVAAFLLSARFEGHVWLNLGLLQFGRSLDGEQRWPEVEREQKVLARAEDALRRAEALLLEKRAVGRALGLVLAGRGQEGMAYPFWEVTPELAEEFAGYGEVARRAEAYESAVVWFRRANGLAPSAVHAYMTALMHERLGQWEQAEKIYLEMIEARRFAGVGESTVYYHLGLIYQWHLTPARNESARQVYEKALAFDNFRSPLEKADSYFRLGQLWEGDDAQWEAALEAYRRAVALQPDHHWAQLRLAIALYQVSGDAAAAEGRIEQAIDLWPGDRSKKWAYRGLGDLYRWEGRFPEAIEAYELAVALDPDDEQSRAVLEELLKASNEAAGGNE